MAEAMTSKFVKIATLIFSFALVTIVSASPKVGYTFVMDRTGSMPEEIKAVGNGIRKLLNSTAGAISNYVIVLFDDPDIGPFLKSSNAEEIKKFLGAITTGGGIDCPEMAMKGLRKAIELSDPGAIIFFFSDASAKDYNLASLVMREAKAKSIVMYFITTDCCDDCKSIGYKAYLNLASATNGATYRVERKDVKDFMEYLFVVTKIAPPLVRFSPKTFEEIRAMAWSGILTKSMKKLADKWTTTTAATPTITSTTAVKPAGTSKSVVKSTTTLTTRKSDEERVVLVASTRDKNGTLILRAYCYHIAVMVLTSVVASRLIILVN